MTRKVKQQPMFDDLAAVASLCDDRASSSTPSATTDPAELRGRRPIAAPRGMPMTPRPAKKRDVLPLPASRGTGKRARGDTRDASLSDYLTSIGRIPLLTADGEVHMASSLREAEVACWMQLLAVVRVVAVVRDSALCAEHEGLRVRLDRIVTSGAAPAAAEHHEDAASLAATLRELDDDRVLVETALAVFDDAVARGEVPASVAARTRADRRRALAVRNAFVRANLRLVVSVARRFHHHRMPLVDLIQEGNLGLIKSVHRFDDRRGFRFSTYAHWWIRQAIERAIMNKGAQVRLPVHVFDARRELARVTRDLTHALGREPTLDELAASMRLPMEKLHELLAAVPREPASLDDTIGDDDDRTLAESIAADVPPPDDQVIAVDETMRARRLLQRLSPMEHDIIRRRYGLGTDDDETLEEIGRSYRLSRERVRQIQAQGLRKIQEIIVRARLAGDGEPALT
ncbi:MAG: sigma-70 family RNA polymerase sigma factor [Deltaproteobacteria bacterium]|nr:sigma-70 family RNA polymerase sigma factor [Deltaproteobacteria bacterium]